MKSAAAAALIVAVAGCGGNARDVFRDNTTGFSIAHNERIMRGVGVSLWGVVAIDGDRGERGALNPAVIEFVLGAPESPLARYYALVIAHPAPPERARLDIIALRAEAAHELPPGARPSGIDYARALARKITPSINRALSTDGRYTGSAAINWGVAADLELGILLSDRESEHARLKTVIHRFEKTRMVIAHSSGTHRMLAWDLSNVPGAFDATAELDYDRVAALAIPLHPEDPR